MSTPTIFRDTNGINYTEDDFNSGSVPAGTGFHYLSLQGTRVVRIPPNITVFDALNLTDSQVAELSEGLVIEGRLTLGGSQVTHLPDGLSARSLDITKSKVKSCGTNIDISQHIFISSSFATNKVKCANIYVEYPESDDLDLANVAMDNLYLRGSGTFNLKNVRASTVTTSDMYDEESKTYRISFSNSVIDTLSLKYRGHLYFNADSSVVIQKMKVLGTESKISLNIENTTINTLEVDGVLSSNPSIVFNTLVLHGDLLVKPRLTNNCIVFPQTSVVYGSLEISKNYELPPYFCCLGNIVRLD